MLVVAIGVNLQVAGQEGGVFGTDGHLDNRGLGEYVEAAGGEVLVAMPQVDLTSTFTALLPERKQNYHKFGYVYGFVCLWD